MKGLRYRRDTYFHPVTRVDEVQLWLNLLFLFCVSLIPFSASLLGEHHNLSTAGIIYGLNLAACVCAMMLNWWYATSQNLLHSNVDSRSIRQLKIRRTFYSHFLSDWSCGCLV